MLLKILASYIPHNLHQGVLEFVQEHEANLKRLKTVSKHKAPLNMKNRHKFLILMYVMD